MHPPAVLVSILLSKCAQHDKSLEEEPWFDMCKGWKKLPSFYPCPCHPSGKRSGSLSLSLSLFLSPLSVSLSDERGAMIASTTKGPAACVWMRLSFLLSFLLLLLYLSLLTPSDLTYSLFPLCCPPYPSSPPPSPSPSLPALSLAAWCQSLALLLRSSLGPRRYNQGTELKIRKCPCRRDTPDGALWCLLGNLKFICCHTSFYSLPLSLSRALSPSAFSFSSSSSVSPPSSAIMYYSVRKGRNEGKGEERKMHRTSVSESPFLSFIFHVFTLWRRREDIMNHLIFFWL